MITVTDNNASYNTQIGISSDGGVDDYSSYSFMSRNTANNNQIGIQTVNSNYNNVTGNTANNNTYYGLYLVRSGSNLITKNSVNNSTKYGIYLWDQDPSNIISVNTVNNNYIGVLVYNSTGNTITGNTANSNVVGMYLWNMTNNKNFSGNTAYYNTVSGLYLWNTIKVNVSSNLFNNNYVGIYASNSTGNFFWLNTIGSNYVNAAGDGADANSWNSTVKLQYKSYTGSSFTNYTGNYWGDYSGPDANSDGIGDTFYQIDINNVDKYPMLLTAPIISGPNALYVSCSIPDTMVAGETYNVKVNFTNSGVTPWNSSNGDVLALWGQTWNYNMNNDTNINGIPAFNLPAGVTVQPGQTFSWNLTLNPQWPGNFGLSFQVVELSSGKWIGNYGSKSMIVYPASPNALFVSSSIPDTMITGNAYNVAINFTNNGNTTWNSNKGDVLAFWGQTWNYNMNNDTSVSGLPAFSIPAGISIRPGQTFSWNLTFVPQWPVSTNIGFQVVEQSSGKWLGNYGSKTTTVNSITPNSAYISNSIPDGVVATSDYSVQINFTNSGNTPWTIGKDDVLVLWGQTWNFNLKNDTSVSGLPAYSLPTGVTVQPGQTFSWNLSLSPQWPGSFGLGFQVVEGSSGKWLGNYGSKSLTVYPAVPSSLYVNTNIPNTMIAGNSYSVSINFTNAGNTTWTSGKGDMLALWGQTWNFNLNNDTSISGLPAYTIPAGITIQPGQTHSWNLTLSPQWPGSFSMGFQVVQQNTGKWLGDYGSKTTTVN